MDKSDTINAIYRSARLHSFIDLVTSPRHEPVEVVADPEFFTEAVEVLRDETENDDLPIQTSVEDDGYHIIFTSLTGEDYEDERYELGAYP